MNVPKLSHEEYNLLLAQNGCSRCSRICTYQDQHLIGMLAESIETYVACTKDIRLNGLVVVHKNGVTGKNHHVEIRDKALARNLQIMNELGLTPKTREKPEPKPSAEMIAFLLGPSAMPRAYGEGPPPLDSICSKVPVPAVSMLPILTT